MNNPKVTSKVVYNGALRTEITHLASGQSQITDAPTDNNGKGEAFSPTDLLATSLGACMLTMVGIKARDMQLDIEGSYVEITKVMYAAPRRVGEIHAKVYFKNIKEKGHKKLFEQIAITCPVALSLNPSILQKIEFMYA